MHNLRVYVRPNLQAVETMRESAEVRADWDGESCLVLSLGGEGETGSWGQLFRIDLSSPDRPKVQVDDWAMYRRDPVPPILHMSDVDGFVKLSTASNELGTPAGPDLLIEYEYHGFLAGSLTHRKQQIHLSGEEIGQRSAFKETSSSNVESQR